MKGVDLLVINANLITMNGSREIFKDYGIAILGDTIIDIKNTEDILENYKSEKVLDAKGKFIFPGMINTHDHLFQVLFKGIGKEKALIKWLADAIQKPFFNISNEDIYLAAMIGSIEQIKSGVTTIVDYQYAHGRPFLSDSVCQVWEDLGMRGILARGYTDSCDFPKYSGNEIVETEEDFFDDVRRLHKKYKNNANIDIALAPGIIWVMTEDGFKKCASLAKELDTFNTIHTLETEEDNAYSMEKFGMSTIDFYEKTGILSSKFLAVHCAQINKEEIKKLKKYDVRVSYNAISNMLIGYQTLPVKDLLEEGLVVGLATDGAASNDNQNMLEVLKISPLWQKAFYRDPSVIPALKVVEMATIDGADAIYKKDEIGSLEVGKKADFFIYNHMKANTVPLYDPIVSLVYSADENNIETTVIGGKIVMENGKIPGVNEEELYAKIQIAAEKLWERSNIKK
ncbi:MAG: amidohydrolase [Firmicutes bacterium]|nr:amidohydrolase [Bacillota bacterium]